MAKYLFIRYDGKPLGYSETKKIALVRGTEKNSSVPNIHYYGNNYSNIYMPKNPDINDRKSRLQAIKQRYYKRMTEQIKSQNLRNKKVLELLDSDFSEKLINALENKTAENYNQFATKLIRDTTVTQDLATARNNLQNALKKKDEKLSYEVLEQLINIFNKDENIASLFKDIEHNRDEIISLVPSKILNIENLLNEINSVCSDPNISFRPQYLASILTAPTEAISALVTLGRGKIDKIADKEVQNVIINILTGTKTMIGKAESVNNGEGYAVIDKAIDYTSGDKYIRRSFSVTDDSASSFTISSTYSIKMKNFYSSKYYFSNSNYINLISHSGSNSFIVKALKDIYSRKEQDEQVNEYNIYNAFAFGESGSNASLNTTFRILRQDLVLQYAEQFLSGFGQVGNLANILVYNLKAYPMGAIVCTIVEQMMDRLNKGGESSNVFLGGTKDLLSISFSKKSAIQANQWKGPKGTNSLYYSYCRIKEVKNAIDKMTFQGRLNRKMLEDSSELRQAMNKIKGIKFL